jgi:hypothetical protein
MASRGTTYHQQGRAKEAEKIEVEVLQLRRGMLNEKHPDRISSTANLGTNCHQQGRAKEAEELSLPARS